MDDFVGFGVAAVVGVFLPILDINIGDTADKKLELALVKDVDEVLGDEVVEACDEGVELLFYALLDTPFCDEPMGRGWSALSLKKRRKGGHTRHIPSYSHSSPQYSVH